MTAWILLALAIGAVGGALMALLLRLAIVALGAVAIGFSLAGVAFEEWHSTWGAFGCLAGAAAAAFLGAYAAGGRRLGEPGGDA
jgi:hypothetical protein